MTKWYCLSVLLLASCGSGLDDSGADDSTRDDSGTDGDTPDDSGADGGIRDASSVDGNTPSTSDSTVSYSPELPQLAFAANELRDAFTETGVSGLHVSLEIDSGGPVESFEIQVDGNNITVVGADASGAMYGGIEVAENLKLGITTVDVARTPFVERRGIKFNIPLDARSPSYDDSGDAANENIENMWDFEGFWQPYLDDLARYRYNVLSLWTTHPFPHMVRVPGYPDCEAADVYRVADGVMDHDSNGKFIVRTWDWNDSEWEPGYLDANENGGDGDGVVDIDKLELVRRMTIDQKIEHWQQVFQYAADRGISISMFHWSVFSYESAGHHGIDGSDGNGQRTDQRDPELIAYTRAAVREMLLTYPNISAIGVCAGENDNENLTGDESTEAFLFNTFGRGIMDAQADPSWDPTREVVMIWRNHSTDRSDVEREFISDYTGGPVEVSVKYTVGRIYSSRRPLEWERRADDWIPDYRVWMNIRNDDIFMHRWGSPDYVRQFIRHMPLEDSPGFMMGSDGYVWGREFISRESSMSGRLEIDKHWYNFRLWGELAYNNELDDNYWRRVLSHRFGLSDSDAALLHDTWQTVSEIVPQLNRAVWAGEDAGFAPEGCIFRFSSATGFLTIPYYYYGEGPRVYNREPMNLGSSPVAGEEQCISVADWGTAYISGTLETLDGLTPLQVADELDSFADAADAALPRLNEVARGNVELQELLLDLESMALLGRYYADKQRCAARYWVYRESGFDSSYDTLFSQAVSDIEEAQAHWETYAEVLESHYHTQLLSRTHYLDWYSILEDGPEIFGAHHGVNSETQNVINRRY